MFVYCNRHTALNHTTPRLGPTPIRGPLAHPVELQEGEENAMYNGKSDQVKHDKVAAEWVSKYEMAHAA